MFGTSSVFTQLAPINPCPTGGGNCPVCPLCPRCPRFCWPIKGFPWEVVKVDLCPKCPIPPCLSCPDEWKRPFDDRFQRVLVAFMPYDKSQQPIGPDRAGEISVEVRDGTPVGDVMDGGAGQYLQLIQYEQGQSPSLTVTAGGVTSEPIRALPRGGGIYRTLTFVLAALLVLALVVIVRQRRPGAARA